MKKLSIFLSGCALIVLALVAKSSFRPAKEDWMLEQIQQQMSVFSSEDLNPDRLHTSFQQLPEGFKLVLFQVHDGKLYYKRNWKSQDSLDRVEKVAAFINHLVQGNHLSDVTFMMTMHDGILTPPGNGGYNPFLPVMTFAKNKQASNAILFPDPLTIDFIHKRYKSLQFEKLKPKNYWSNKVEKAFWRGGTTGGQYLASNWHQMPRTQLSMLSKFYPDEVDAGFSVFCEIDPGVEELMLKALPKLDWVGHKKHLRYKYLVIADGNTCTYPRFYLGLMSGSLVFKDQSEHTQWFYSQLVPNQHYVEVATDFSDLPEKVRWAKNHDKQAQTIARNAQQFIKEHLTIKHIERYAIALLEEYADLQQQESFLQANMNLYDSKEVQ